MEADDDDYDYRRLSLTMNSSWRRKQQNAEKDL